MAALLGPHAHLARRCGQAARYLPDVSPFLALPLDPDEGAWADLAKLLGPAGVGSTLGVPAAPPPGWEVLLDVEGVQMVEDRVAARPDPEAIMLGAADVPEMLDLVARTRPGPFLARTIEHGSYLGIRRNGELIAMAGERVRAPGWTEISAVCTDERFRGEGLGTRLVQAVAAGISGRGETAFLHAAARNTGAIRLYQALGFRVRRSARFVAVRAPASRAAA
ncbi:MAG TPA: GNAT family N-acetyltransferase [Streptosporangiaceae bacterium]|nr:GNAT family N-acetyltransferase [Streptosporangiaceae bacterium]